MRTYGVTIIFVAFLLVYRFFYNPLVKMRFEEEEAATIKVAEVT